VKAIAEAHHGGVSVDSEPGRTRFRAWIGIPPASGKTS